MSRNFDNAFENCVGSDISVVAVVINSNFWTFIIDLFAAMIVSCLCFFFVISIIYIQFLHHFIRRNVHVRGKWLYICLLPSSFLNSTGIMEKIETMFEFLNKFTRRHSSNWWLWKWWKHNSFRKDKNLFNLFNWCYIYRNSKTGANVVKWVALFLAFAIFSFRYFRLSLFSAFAIFGFRYFGSESFCFALVLMNVVRQVFLLFLPI